MFLRLISRSFSTKKTIFNQPNCDYQPYQKYNGLSSADIQTIRANNLSAALTTYYADDFVLYDGKMQWLFDNKSNRYLDMFGGIATISVGHCHPKINDALKCQMESLWHTSNVYLHPKVHEYASRLADYLPKNLQNIYLVNSGSEANDLAVLIAKLHTKGSEIISLRNCYHGMTGTIMDVTSMNTYRYPITSRNSVHRVPNPDVFKGAWGGRNCRHGPTQANRDCGCLTECAACDLYLDEFKAVLNSSISKNDGHLAAFIFEPIQGVGGVNMYPKEYIQKASELVHDYNGLVIADEVQTGFGRTGDSFWGFELHGIEPDIVTMAKGIGNGFPLGAVATSKNIGDSLKVSKHFNTFGGNALASTVGLSVLNIIEEEKCQLKSKTVGTHLLEKLDSLRDNYEFVGDVRGKGLMIGIELINPKTLPEIVSMSSEIMSKIMYESRNHGLLIGLGGINGNIIRLMPPMCITKEDADFTYEVLNYIFSKINLNI